jgi:hypothetical protein
MVILRVDSTTSAYVEREVDGQLEEIKVMVKAPEDEVAFVWYDETHDKTIHDGLKYVYAYLKSRDYASFAVICNKEETSDLLNIGRAQYNDFLKASGVKS